MRFSILMTDRRGATTIEYAAIASLISVFAIVAIATLGTSVSSLWATIPAF